MASPLSGGSAISLAGGRKGTLGCLVTVGGETLILGSAHVMAQRGASPAGTPIYAVASGSTLGDKIATLKACSPPVNFSTSAVNGLDAALAKPLSADLVTARVGTLEAPKGYSELIAVDMDVQVWGATSSFKRSVITKTDWTGTVKYPDGKSARFGGLVRCAPAFSEEGDSGAVVLDDDGYVLGVTVGGGDEFSVFCPMWMLRQRWTDLEIVDV